MATPISANHGIDAARNALIANDPEGVEAYRKLMSPADPSNPNRPGTMHKLVLGHNQVWGADGLAAQVAQLREELRLRPF